MLQTGLTRFLSKSDVNFLTISIGAQDSLAGARLVNTAVQFSSLRIFKLQICYSIIVRELQGISF